jgi:hypothetical protein
MVSLNSRAGLRHALESGRGPFSAAYSLPQFSVEHTFDIASHRSMLPKLDTVLEAVDRDNMGKVRVDNTC